VVTDADAPVVVAACIGEWSRYFLDAVPALVRDLPGSQPTT
jgi:hypothetical protein